ncbi:hypothetical protein BKK79_13130 [Cupriavidus sp. USMAA2-4]|uniref:Uncharacterized protein n=1 Tax=Cupriavidus malaysiensis TaxID=367825 RepID=A0ABM6F7U3_9BURK|nr:MULTISPECIES: hypothetical protein [Cupriavidus]AOY92617.1 hypothetical protein BKK79_13130 [Cupriavidus sp. USMAA2-4]AOZ00937.1 hypothetical protein BKK81_18060 [Cupriavidus sp. USMAHM13]AOZ07669.1 hypothetical protein BKK80_18915 [Cupriavidus malaysiensis]
MYRPRTFLPVPPSSRLTPCLAALATVFAAAGTPARAEDAAPARDTGVCRTAWFAHGGHVQMEADGNMPLSRRSTQQPPRATAAGCEVEIEIRSKTALAALMGPPIVTEQQQRVLIQPPADGQQASVTGSAMVNAWGPHARLYGMTTIDGLGLLDYQYRGQDLREGSMLDGETVDSSASFTIYARESGEEVGKLVAPHATVEISVRQVGKRRVIQTALGPSECLPIRYVRTTSVGRLIVAGVQVLTEPSRMSVTDWFCPAEGFVMRQDIVEGGEAQRIDTTMADRAQAPAPAPASPRTSD